ncbi:conserved oligomeric Golgi complex subunit 7-like [Liolophura sinensis]|uniref:conserved oligomeric Golgi complex subunit 7-like n=1 Tax=Liolophura sinensis TaxID=3198878 RepID=UPI003158D2DA
MDVSKFLDDHFDAKEWVNSAFRAHKDPGVSKDQHATTLVMKLQKFIQEVNIVVEEASNQAIQNLPKVMREIEAVKQEATLLREQMRTVKHDIQKVEQDTAQSMQMLLQLDGIKSRMKAASDALKEADNWTTLSADVEDVFSSQDIQAITVKLVGMQQSLQMLVDTPDYADRCQYLEKLKNRLEAILSPQLVAAFNSQSLDMAQMYSGIFRDINRLPQLYKYYHKCHKGTLLQAWQNILETNSGDTLVEWLTELYDTLLSTWHAQVKWCGQVFRNPVPIVCDLLTEVLNSLNPSLPESVGTLLQEKGDTLNTLITLKEITERFAKSIEGAVESHMTDDPSHVKSLEKLLNTVYSPFRPYILKYRTFEELALNNDLDNIRLDHQEIIDTVRLLGDSVSKLFSAANQANERCLKLTDGCGYLSLLEGFKNYFLNYAREFRRVLVNIQEKCRMDKSSQDAEDWSLFQHSLRIIQTCGELIMHTDELDQTIISSIITSIGSYHLSPSTTHKVSENRVSNKKNLLHAKASLLLSNLSDIEALESLVVKLDEGDTPSVLPEVKKEICSLSEAVHKFAFDIVFAQLQVYLTGLGEYEMWTSQSTGGALTSDLPTFSMSPQEYITKIGQYLMTLPQQLEPFTMQDNPAVVIALKHGRLPYTDEQEIPEHTADLWLESIACGTMHVYCEEILKIHQITPHATRQLVTDIDYLGNVLEDLGLRVSDTLMNIVQLLQAKAEEYPEVAKTLPQRLTHAISSMRGIEL